MEKLTQNSSKNKQGTKRKYKEEYIKYGFTATDDEKQLPLNSVCKKLSQMKCSYQVKWSGI